MTNPRHSADLQSEGFCPRCGRETSPCHCGQMVEFEHVETLDRLDSEVGLSLFRMKRFGHVEAGYRFVREGVIPLVERAEALVAAHPITRLVVVPMSRGSFYSLYDHPNEWILRGLQARARCAESPLHRIRGAIHFGIHAGPSRSASRRALGSRSDEGPLQRQETSSSSLSFVHWRPELPPRNGGVSGQREALLIIDDVLTTGHSASKAATLADPMKNLDWICLGVARASRRKTSELS